jgi:phage anti-repressor protein
MILSYDAKTLIDQWMEAERNGEQFPVDFDIAWKIAGYSRKDSAKRKLIKLTEGIDFHRDVEMVKRPQGGGAKSEVFHLTCDSMKHLCMMSETEEGHQVRQYFIETEKKWKLLQTTNPLMAQEIELQHLKNEGLRLEAQKETAIAQAKQADLSLVQFRHTVVTLCDDVVQQKVLGYSEVTKVEYRDRIIKDDDIVNNGSTVTKSELCKRLGLMRHGKPDYKTLNHYIDDSGLKDNPDAWQMSAYIQENEQLKREYIGQLDDYYRRSHYRPRYLVE